jgi:hypothetical protein
MKNTFYSPSLAAAVPAGLRLTSQVVSRGACCVVRAAWCVWRVECRVQLDMLHFVLLLVLLLFPSYGSYVKRYCELDGGKLLYFGEKGGALKGELNFSGFEKIDIDFIKQIIEQDKIKVYSPYFF